MYPFACDWDPVYIVPWDWQVHLGPTPILFSVLHTKTVPTAGAHGFGRLPAVVQFPALGGGLVTYAAMGGSIVELNGLKSALHDPADVIFEGDKKMVFDSTLNETPQLVQGPQYHVDYTPEHGSPKTSVDVAFETAFETPVPGPGVIWDHRYKIEYRPDDQTPWAVVGHKKVYEYTRGVFGIFFNNVPTTADAPEVLLTREVSMDSGTTWTEDFIEAGHTLQFPLIVTVGYCGGS